jgi:CheY-like chemotaxis protein
VKLIDPFQILPLTVTRTKPYALSLYPRAVEYFLWEHRKIYTATTPRLRVTANFCVYHVYCQVAIHGIVFRSLLSVPVIVGVFNKIVTRLNSLTSNSTALKNIRPIIIVDDDEEDHMMLDEYFCAVGISDKVTFLINGQLALQYLESIEDSSQLPKLMVLDLNMPILTGSQVLMQIKETPRLKDIPVIIFSTSVNENEKKKCLSCGALEYLVKPITWDEGDRIAKRFASFVA